MSKKIIKLFSTLVMVCCLCGLYSCSDGNNSKKDNGGSDGGTQTDDTVRILAIGNSFSEDAVEQNLWDLYNAAGKTAIIGNLYIGGCSLETHYENAVANSADYSYRKVVNGNKSTTANVTMLSGIVNENWDYISIQQSSPLSGMYDTYVNYLPYLVQYIRTNAKNPNVKVVFHQTWAYASNSTHSGFANYGRNQLTMYNGIMDASKRAVEDNGIEILVPSGTAIQNGRNTWIGDNFNRDGYHLELTYGRFTAACTWFETLSGIDVTTTGYTPSGLEEKYKDVAVNAAHLAVQSPYSANEMADWVRDPDVPESISSSVSSLNFSADGGSYAVTVTANGPWTADSPSWLTVSPSSSTSGCSVTVTASKNTGEERTGVLTFALNSGAGEASLNVTQTGN